MDSRASQGRDFLGRPGSTGPKPGPKPFPLSLAPAEMWPGVPSKVTESQTSCFPGEPVSLLRLGLEPSPQAGSFRKEPPPPTSHQHPLQTRGSWADTVVSISRMVTPRGQRPVEPCMARAGQAADERRQGNFRRKTLTSRLEDSPGCGLRTSWEWGRLKPATQLLFVFLLLGSLPKQTNRGGKMKGICRRGKCPG